jgi:predicted DNA-binding protein (MmcQ/YjbR family)
MHIEEIRDYSLAKPGVTEGFPFDETTLVFKVMNKMYALEGLERVPPFINLKCDPERAIELRNSMKPSNPVIT